MSKKKQAEPAELDGEVLPPVEPAPEVPPPPPEPPAELRSVDAWAAELFPPSPKGRQHPLRFLHGAAYGGHRWKACAEHEGRPMELSRADYEAAIEAAKTAPFTPYPPALYTRF